MRSITTTTAPSLLLFTLLPSLAFGFTLSTFQPISGFSQSCNNAYNTPLAQCNPSDFSSGSCSQACITFLDALTKVINADCTGTSAHPNTLIAAFFYSQGTQTLCPNKQKGGGLSGGDDEGGDSNDLPGVLGHQGAEASVTYAHGYSFSAIPPLSTSTTSSSTDDTESTTTRVAIASTTVTAAPSNPTNATPNASSTTTKSSTSTSAPNPNDANGGGGTVLDIGSNASCRNMNVEAWILCLLVGSAGLLVFI